MDKFVSKRMHTPALSADCQELLAALRLNADAMRVGLFGGTFDPIHGGHTAVARAIQQRLDLDHLCLIPAARPPHKERAFVAEAHHRLAMVRLAARHEPSWRVADLELRRPGPSYTIDTVRCFQACLAPQTGLYLVVGLDAFLEIDTWYAFRRLFQACAMVIMTRPRPGETQVDHLHGEFELFLQTVIDAGYRRDPQQPHMCYVHSTLRPVYYIPVPVLEISSTRVRRAFRRGTVPQADMDPAVVAYIHEHRLYQ